LTENKELRKAIAKIKAKEQKKKEENVVVPGLNQGTADLDELNLGKFDPTIPEDCFMTEYNEEDLKAILDQQQKIIDVLKAHGLTKYCANRIALVFDDLVGSTLFSNARRSPFKMLNTNHRHLSTSVFMISQAFKEIPKTVRTQFSCLIMFEILSDSELEAIYNEFPMGLKKDQWMELYHFATEGDHDFLFYNIQKPKRLRIMKNFDKVLFFG